MRATNRFSFVIYFLKDWTFLIVKIKIKFYEWFLCCFFTGWHMRLLVDNIYQTPSKLSNNFGPPISLSLLCFGPADISFFDDALSGS